MKKAIINDIHKLREILEGDGDEYIELSLGKKTYELSQTINIKRSNFSVNGNGAVIKGSRTVDFSSFPKIGDTVKIDLKKYGIPVGDYHSVSFPWCVGDRFEECDEDPFGTSITDGPMCGGINTVDYAGPDIELFYNGEAMRVSRYPKEGYIDIEKTLSETIANDPMSSCYEGGGRGIFIPADEKFTKMEKAEEALLFGYWSYDWCPHFHSVKSVNSKDNIIEVDGPYDFWGYWDGRGKDKLRGRFYASNVYGALNEPGTWFLDRKNKELYIFPLPGQTNVEISYCGTFFNAYEAKNIAFKNLTLCRGKSCGFHFKAVRDVDLENIIIRNVGEWGIIADDSENVVIADSEISHTGAGGIYMVGGDRVSLTPSGTAVKNCDISDVARWYGTYTPGIYTGGCGTVISACRIHDLPHTAILFRGNCHIIEKNEICDVCRSSNDAGAVYSGKDYTFYGNIIRYNYFHDIYGLEGKGCACLYFDDCMSSAEVYENIFADLAYSVQLGGGHDFSIHNNTFYNCDFLFIDNRGKRGSWMNDMAEAMRSRLKASPYRNEAWELNFPQLQNLDIDSDEFFFAYGNTFKDNIFINCGDIYLGDSKLKDWILFENNRLGQRTQTFVSIHTINACKIS